MPQKSSDLLMPQELDDLRRLAGFMIPASTQFGTPGADDPVIFADIANSLGRDLRDVKAALAILRDAAGGSFAALIEQSAKATAMAFLGRQGKEMTALGRVVLQAYYRDDRVFRSLGREPRAPFPKGHSIEPGDWSLLEAVRGRPRMWRDVDNEVR